MERGAEEESAASASRQLEPARYAALIALARSLVNTVCRPKRFAALIATAFIVVAFAETAVVVWVKLTVAIRLWIDVPLFLCK